MVFFDIDGTIWDWKRVIPKSTVTAIRRLRENGHKAIICSGRAKGNIRTKELLDIGFDGIVAACGAYVEIDGEVIENRLISDDIAKLTVETIDKYRMPSVLEGPTKHWISGWGFEGDEYVDTLYRELGDEAVTLNGYTPEIRINKFAADVLRLTDYEAIKRTLEPYYDFIWHGVTPDVVQEGEQDEMTIMAVVEAVQKGFSKARGIELLCKHMGVQMNDTYAIGDSANDLEMFEAVGHAIAMGNATDSAKNAAEFITTSIHEDGIENALIHYGLI